MREQFIALLHISVQPDDSDETREKKALSIALAIGMSLGGIIWGFYLLIGSEPGAAMIPFAYTLVTFVNILYLRVSGNDNRFRSFQIFLSLMLPFLLMVSMGGFRSSGAVVIWSLVAPLGATLFTGRREASVWFISFFLLVVFSGLIEPIIAHLNNLSPLMITIFYVMNILAPTSLAIVLLFYFLQQRQQALELLKEARVEAEAANQAKSTFLANMSHELRSPMNAILGFTQVMLRSPELDASDKENLNVILRSGEHLLALINQVLDLSKVEAGRMELIENTFDLYGLIEELEQMFSLQAANKGVQLIFVYGRQVPHYVQLDELKLRQVLINLLNNALKFTEKGSVRVVVDSGREEMGSRAEAETIHRFIFEVEDSGPGIKPDELDTVFAAFSQTETGMRAGGAGLGLPISRQLVRLMGGDMQVSSQVGKGTKFRFDILGRTVKDSVITRTGDADGRFIIGLESGQPNYRILIVDDEWENREALFRLLNPIGFDLRQAENGQEAVAIAREWRPHLIWMDIRMPVMDGYEASRAINAAELDPEPVIIALTASTFMEESALASEAGCMVTVHKPYREREIFDTIKQYLGLRYRYELPFDTQEAQVGSLVTASRLATLPLNLREQLSDALIQLDTVRMEQLVTEIRSQDKSLAEAIAGMLNQFKYEPLLEALEGMEQ